MSTNFHLQQTCNLGCQHEWHVGKRYGGPNGTTGFIVRTYPVTQVQAPPIRNVADLLPTIRWYIQRGWRLMDECHREVTPMDMGLHNASKITTCNEEFS
jgi:hypothetical protein